MPPFTVTPSTMHTPSTSSPPSTVEPGGGVPPLGQLDAAASAGTAIIPSASSAKTPTNTRTRTFMFAKDILTSLLLGLFTGSSTHPRYRQNTCPRRVLIQLGA